MLRVTPHWKFQFLYILWKSVIQIVQTAFCVQIRRYSSDEEMEEDEDENERIEIERELRWN